MKEILKLIFGLPRFKKRFLIFVVAILLAQGVAIQVLPFVERGMLEIVQGSSRYGSVSQGLVFLALIAIVATVVNAVFMRVSYFMASILKDEVWYGVFNRGFKKLIYHDLAYLSADRSSGLLNKVTRAAYKLADLFTESAAAFFRNMTRAFVSLGILFFLSWQIGLGVLCTLLMYTVIYYFRFRADRPFSKERDRLEEEDFSRVYEVVPQAKLVKIFTNEEKEIEDLEKMRGKFVANTRKREWLWNWANMIELPFVSIPTIGLVFFAAWQTIQGVYGIPTLVLIISMIHSVQDPMWVVNWFMWEMQFTYDRAKKFQKIMEAEIKVKEPINPVELNNSGGDIKLTNVSFKYNEMKEPVLNEFNAVMPGGKMTALVGKSGVGKTTITNLICRFFDPKKGTVKIGGVNIKRVGIQDLREQIGFVLQESFVFSGTVIDNMRYAKEKAKIKEIELALVQAGAWEFVQKLPKKLKTQIGERGVKLSGGQKQRLSIAMMILKNPPIVILDEATNALDSESEMAVQEALAGFLRGKTVVVVAHRLSTVQQADQILVVDEGQVQESGTHDELVTKKGVYAMLWKIQSGGYEREKEIMESYELE